jgi:putative acetyltransferase
MPGPRLVPFRPEHAAGVSALIETVYAEYGMTFDRDYESDLFQIEQVYLDRGGWFHVLLDDARVAGSVAARPKDDGTCEIKRVYLARALRGRGHGRAMMEAVLGWAAARGYRVAVAWSDVRLQTAHAMYRRLGFEAFGERTLDDPDRSHEIGFRLALGGQTGDEARG